MNKIGPMPKLAVLQIQLAWFTPDGAPRYACTRTILGRFSHRWNDLSDAEIAVLMKCFQGDMRLVGAKVSRIKDSERKVAA